MSVGRVLAVAFPLCWKGWPEDEQQHGTTTDVSADTERHVAV
ncbi:hypothetical protein ACFXPV_28440 [Streptomyces sp. NPDC059118]